MPPLVLPEARLPRAWQGTVPEVYHSGDVPLATYLQMQERDPIVKFASRFLQRSVRRRLGDYRHDDERVQAWVRARVLPTVHRHLRRVQTAVYLGCSLCQPEYALVDGELALVDLHAAHPSRYWGGRGFRRDGGGHLEAVWIQGLDWVPLVDAGTGVRQLVHYASDDDFGNPWGLPAARQAYTAWYIKHRLSGFEAIGLEKHGTGTALFKVHDDQPDTAGGTRPSEQYVADWAGMGSNSAIAIGGDDELTIVQPGWGAGNPFDAVLRRLDAYIFNSFYMPYLLTSEAQFGTRAQATVTLETYLMAETDLAEELADGIVRDQIIGPAVGLQFGPGTPPGDVAIRDASPPDREAWSRILQALDSVGAFNAEVDEQLRWAGELFEVPTDALSDLLAQGTTFDREPLA